MSRHTEDAANQAWLVLKVILIFTGIYLMVLQNQLQLNLSEDFAVINATPDVQVSQDGTVRITWLLLNFQDPDNMATPNEVQAVLKSNNQVVWQGPLANSNRTGLNSWSGQFTSPGLTTGRYDLSYTVRVPRSGLMASIGGNAQFETEVSNLSLDYQRSQLGDLGPISLLQGSIANYPTDLLQYPHDFDLVGQAMPGVVGISPAPVGTSTPAGVDLPAIRRGNQIYYHEADGYASFWAGGALPVGSYKVAVRFSDGPYMNQWATVAFSVQRNIPPAVYSDAQLAANVLEVHYYDQAIRQGRMAVDLISNTRVLDVDGRTIRRGPAPVGGAAWGAWIIEPTVSVIIRPADRADNRLFLDEGNGRYYLDLGALNGATGTFENIVTVSDSDGLATQQMSVLVRQ